MHKTVAIIAAGGQGKRMHQSLPKQYALLNGHPVLAHTLMVFQRSTIIDSMFLVVPADDLEFVFHEIVKKYDLSKVKHVLKGGKERQDSVRCGIEALTDDCEIVIIHDGVRPFVTDDLIHSAVNKALNEGAVAIGVPVKDTVKSVDGHGWIQKTLNRDPLWLTQTPQVFKRDVIKEAYKRAYEDNFYGTDDACLVERIGLKVKMMHGSYNNIKITTQDDLLIAQMFIKSRPVQELVHTEILCDKK